MSENNLQRTVVNIFVRIAIDIFCGTPAIMFIATVLMKSSTDLLAPLRWFFNSIVPSILENLNIVCERDLALCLVVYLMIWCILGLLIAEFFRLILYLQFLISKFRSSSQ